MQVVGGKELHATVPPRAFVFAYEQKGWKTLPDFVDSVRKTVGVSAHIHGTAVLDSDGYVTQEAFANPPKLLTAERDALLNFVNDMLHSIGSVDMMQMSIDRYYREDD